MPGKTGNFDCSQFVSVVDKPAAVDRSMGDVHPFGNPHYHFSPSNMLRVAEGMTALLADVDSGNAGFYQANLKAFSERLRDKQKQWNALMLKGRKFIAYHKLFEYLSAEFGLRFTGYIEPKPGIPPSAAHIEGLIETMKRTRPDGIIVTPAYGLKEAESLSAKTGVKVVVVPNDVGALPGAEDWFSFMDKVTAALQ